MSLIKAGDGETNPSPTTTRKQVWICDICHRQIQVMKQISIRCNRIEHWVHLRCACIRLSQYTATWTCHQHKESRLTRHTYITPPFPPRPKPTTHSPNTTHTTATKHKHIPLSPCSYRICKPQTQLSYTQHLPPRPRAKHMSHTPPTHLTTLISSTSPVLDKTPEPRVPPIYALTATTPPPDPTPALPPPSHPNIIAAYTHSTQTTVHASKSPQQPHPQHRVPPPHRQTKDYHGTTNTTQAHRPSSKSERNLIILQVNINIIKNKLEEEFKLLIHDTHADIITLQETKLTHKVKHQNYIASQQCVTIGCTRQEMGSSHSLETT